MAYLVLALALGGAGRFFPLLEMVLELGALGLLLRFAWDARRSHIGWDGRSAIALLLLAASLPALQLVPLPPSIWMHLPGRELANEVNTVAGLGGLWRPVSLWPEGTRRALLGMLPGAAMLITALYLPWSARLTLVKTAVGFAIVAVALGALQLASGHGEGVTPYMTDHIGYPVGFFVNRNHQAAFLNVAIVLAAGVAAAQRRSESLQPAAPWVAVALMGLFALGVVATTSRMGLTVLPIAIAFALLILLHRRLSRQMIAAVLIGVAALAVTALRSPLLERTLDRFSAEPDERYLFWQDTMWALPHYLPFGAGMGSFIPVYRAAESLNHVGARIVNNAHNDYLEVLLDGGIPAMIVAALFAGFLLFTAFQLLKRSSRRPERQVVWASLAAIVLLLLHSVVDYPLRTSALSALLGMLVGLLCTPAAEPQAQARVAPGGEEALATPARSSGERKFGGGGALIAALFVAWQSVAAGLSQHDVLEERFAQAAAIAPWSSAARDGEATRLILEKQPQAAAVQARAALVISPVDVVALRTLALAREAGNDRSGAAALMATAAKLGWWDGLTQLWLVQDAMQRQDAAVLVQRADALLRQNVLTEQMLAMLHSASVAPATGALVAKRLEEAPNWRRAFLAGGATLQPEAFEGQRNIFLALERSKAPPTPAEARGFLRQLVDAGNVPAAYELWRRLGQNAVPFDGGFERSAESVGGSGGGPFEWQVPSLLSSSVSVDRPDDPIDGLALRVQTDGLAVGPVLSQTLLLKPGRYRLSAWVRDIEPNSIPTFVWELTCPGIRNRAEPLIMAVRQSRRAWSQVRGEVNVVQSCPIQQLTLRSTANGRRAVRIDDVDIRGVAVR
jgi:O-antigen ligase